MYYGRDETCTYDNGLSNEGVARSSIISLVSTSGAAVELDYFLGTEGGGFYDQASLAVAVNGGPFQIVESNFSALFIPVELRGMRSARTRSRPGAEHREEQMLFYARRVGGSGGVDPLAGVRGARSVARVRGGRDSPAGVSATTPVSFYFASPICGFASCSALRSALDAVLR